MINYSYIHKLILPKTIRLMLYESFRGSQIEDIVKRKTDVAAENIVITPVAVKDAEK